MNYYRLISTMILLRAFTSLVGASLSILHLGMTYYRSPRFDRSEFVSVFAVLNMNLHIFLSRWNGESLRESIKRHEHFLALQLDLKPGHKVRVFLYERGGFFSVRFRLRGITCLYSRCWMLDVELVDRLEKLRDLGVIH